ncbi:MAG: alpha-L-fucosidase [Mangrovibacterium sp.]
MKNKLAIAVLAWLCFIGTKPAFSQAAHRVSVHLEHGAHRLGQRTDPAMAKWRNYGLGQFIHWGVYAIPGGQWKEKKYPGAAEWIRAWDQMPQADYDSLYLQFNPKNFDAKAWAKQAKDMGARYMIITTKHHDGFCLWPSRYTRYTIANSPYKNDIIKQLVDAYTHEGIDVYLYFSVIDWDHPGYRTEIETKADSLAYDDFKQFTRNQLLELLDRYPQTKGLWFDGTWDDAWKQQAEFADKLETEMRNKIPGLIIGSRFRPDEFGNRHFDANGDLMGDYEQGWERKIPENSSQLNGNDWDCVMTIPNNQWGYDAAWEGHIKSSYELIEMLVKCVSMNGNFVLNFGPDSKGAIREQETGRAREIGEWMKLNNPAIYDCGDAGLAKPDWGYYTRNRLSGKIYALLFNVPLNGRLRLKCPDKTEIIRASPIGKVEESLAIERITATESDIILNSRPLDKPVVFEIEFKQQKKDPTDDSPKI